MHCLPIVQRSYPAVIVPKTKTLTYRSSLLTSTLNISVTDLNGKDLSNSVTILHHQQTLGTSTKAKRATPRPVDNCPEGFYLRRSRCLRTVNARAVIMECGTIMGTNLRRVIGLNCAENEICVDGVPWPMGMGIMVETAFCVTTDNFIKIARAQLGDKAPPATIPAPFRASKTQIYSIDAVLAGLNPNSAVIASSIEIQAQTYDTFSNVQTWRSLPNGTEQCNDCGSIAITPVPDGTQRFSIKAVLQPGTAGALLYLASIMMPS